MWSALTPHQWAVLGYWCVVGIVVILLVYFLCLDE